jgi:hypothetical protein
MGEATPWGVAVFVLVPILAVLISIVFRQKKNVEQDMNTDEVRRIAKMEAMEVQILLLEELKPIHKELSKISGDLREVRTVLETLGIKGLKRTPGCG